MISDKFKELADAAEMLLHNIKLLGLEEEGLLGVRRLEAALSKIKCVHDWRGIDTGRMCASCGEIERQI